LGWARRLAARRDMSRSRLPRSRVRRTCSPRFYESSLKLRPPPVASAGLEGGKRDAFDPGGPGFVDKDELFRVETELGLKPSLTAFQDIRPILLGCMRGLFLSVTRLRAKKRDSAEMLNEWPAAAKAACISASVASPSGPSRERMKSAWLRSPSTDDLLPGAWD